MIPDPWVALVLALGVYRVFRLLGWDDFPPIARLRGWVTGEHVYTDTTRSPTPLYRYRRPVLEHFINCPYCLGFWLSLAAYLGWRWEPRGTLYALAPFALNGAVGLVAQISARLSD